MVVEDAYECYVNGYGLRRVLVAWAGVFRVVGFFCEEASRGGLVVKLNLALPHSLSEITSS